MPELIATIILVCSLLGMLVILFRKIPVLLELPEISQDESLVLGLKKKMKSLPGVRDFSYEIFLQKLLSKVRILTLRTDNKTSGWLEKLRKKSNQKNNLNNDKYWEELKKAKNGK